MICKRINALDLYWLLIRPNELPINEVLLSSRCRMYHFTQDSVCLCSTSIALILSARLSTVPPHSFPTPNNTHSLSTFNRRDLNKLHPSISTPHHTNHGTQSRSEFALRPRDGASSQLHALHEDEARGSLPADSNTRRVMTDT